MQSFILMQNTDKRDELGSGEIFCALFRPLSDAPYISTLGPWLVEFLHPMGCKWFLPVNIRS